MKQNQNRINSLSEYDQAVEDLACELVRSLCDSLALAAEPVWHWGDGNGGWVKAELDAAIARLRELREGTE